MHFGRVQDDKNLDLSLVEDRPRTRGFLGLGHQGRRLIYPGASIWADKDWVGTLYPSGTRSADYLRIYAEHYASVESNGSFYHLPSSQQIRHWRSQVGAEFRFCPKVPKEVSHTLASGLNRPLLQAYLDCCEEFGEHYGMSFLQLPDGFGPEMGRSLEVLLAAWSSEWPLAIEFRHPGWFKDHMLLDPLINLLYRYKVSAVITDTPGRRDVLHLSLTAPSLIVRFQGCFPSPKDDRRLSAWADRLHEWAQSGLDALYFFVHQERHAAIPAGVDYMVRALLERQAPGLMLPARREQTSDEEASHDGLWI